MTRSTGIHHVTAISGEPRATVQFYGDTLGLRMVKRTVNFDDPGTWHLYFGDETGSPGSILTFFAWPDGNRGRTGVGQAAVTAFAVPEGSLGYWMERFGSRGVAFDGPVSRLGERAITVRDPDGLLLELVSAPVGHLPVPAASPVPAEHAIRGFHGTTIWTDGAAPETEAVLRSLGFELVAEEEGRRRFGGTAELGRFVDLKRADGFWGGSGGVGTVHHVAFRVLDDAAQATMRTALVGDGLQVTPVVDRMYFNSIYFREPGGVLFEVATDSPGFLLDEPVETLGTELRLPPRYEPYRARIAEALPPLEPAGVEVA